MLTKRSRSDGQVSKEDYEKEEINSQITSEVSSNFSKANAEVMASRKVLVANRNSRQEEFLRHIKALNQSFFDWFKLQLSKQHNQKPLSLVEGSQDYIDYMNQLENRFLKTHGEVLTFGSGDCGQLAHGNEEDKDLIVKFPRIVYSLRDKKVCGISCGGLHNAVYTETGQVYTWGCNDDGSLGRVGEETSPLLVTGLLNEVVTSVCCGDGQTLVLTITGDVYGWGCYKDKEGGKWFNSDPSSVKPYKDIKKQRNEPLRIVGLKNISEIACGSSFNLARGDDGSCYSWGIGECGELGRETIVLKSGRDAADQEGFLNQVIKEHLNPGPMFTKDNKKIDNVKSVGCGSYHALIVTIGGNVYSCGLNNYSQLGLGNTNDQSKLHVIEALTHKAISICRGGMHHSLALSSIDGKLYAWGRADYCQLGVKDSSFSTAGSYSTKPVQVILPDDVRVVDFACGGNHNLALVNKHSDDKTLEVYTWGYGDMSALGHGKDQDEPIPRRLDFSRAKVNNILVTQVSGGGQHSAIIGKVISTKI